MDEVVKENPVTLSWEADVAHIVLDHPGETVNKLDVATLDAFEVLLDQLEARETLAGVTLSSGKQASFVVGADVRMLAALREPSEAARLSRRAHEVLNRLRRLEAPTVAAIHGAAMGGGLELALACRYRVATDDPSTRLALPEVKLGLCPGAGGTQYLPRLIGIQRALPLLLSGRNVYPHQAKRMGLVEEVCARPLLMQTAAGMLREENRSPGDALPISQRAIGGVRPIREFAFARARKRVLEESGGHYPAPLRIIDVVRAGFEYGPAHGLIREAEAFGELLFTPACRALVSLFFGRQEATRPLPSPAPRSVGTIGLLGAGLMGSGIAEISASSGFNVLVKDRDLTLAAQAVQSAARSSERLVAKHALSAFEAERRLARIVPVSSYDRLRDADLVIEAVSEDLDLKHQVLSDVERVVDAHCILATNTSAIPIKRLREPLARPDRLIGMHYFSPVRKMPLLEIVRQPDTPDDVLATAHAVGLRQGKAVIVVSDGPGFYTTRVLSLYLNEALLLFQEGAPIDQVDAAVRRFGFPMGPFEVFDLVGLGTAASITSVLESSFAEREVPVSDIAARLSARGAKGFHGAVAFYDRGRRRRSGPGRSRRGSEASRDESIRAILDLPRPVPQEPDEIVSRLVLLFVNEAIRCLEEGVLQGPRDGDVGAVFGLGFPPYAGGPFHYADRLTAQALVLRLERLKFSHGLRFEPSRMLDEMAGRGEGFYPQPL